MCDCEEHGMTLEEVVTSVRNLCTACAAQIHAQLVEQSVKAAALVAALI